MAAEEDKSGDFYSVLGLRKECSETELRNAYKKLAMVRLGLKVSSFPQNDGRPRILWTGRAEIS